MPTRFIEIGVGVALAFAVLIWPDPWSLIKWGGFVVGLCLIAWGVVGLIRDKSRRSQIPTRNYWLPMWHLNAINLRTPPFRRLIPLHKAARLAYEETRTTLGVKLQEHLNKDPKGMLGVLAEQLLNDKNGENIAIFGAYPPSEKIEQIPDEDAHTFGFTGDATEMFDYANETRRYRNLHIKRKDFKRRLSEIKAKGGA